MHRIGPDAVSDDQPEAISSYGFYIVRLVEVEFPFVDRGKAGVGISS